MHQDSKEKLAPDSPDWLGKTLAFLGAGAFWYTWYSYQDWMAVPGIILALALLGALSKKDPKNEE